MGVKARGRGQSQPRWSYHPTVAQAQAACGEQKWQVHTDQCLGWANWRGGGLFILGDCSGPGVVQIRDWLCWAAGFWVCHFAESKAMAPLGRRPTKLGTHKYDDVCNRGYVMWRLRSQLVGPGLILVCDPINHSFSPSSFLLHPAARIVS